MSKRLYSILLFLWILFWTFLFLIPAKYFPSGSGQFLSIPHFDKIIHSFIFFVIGGLLYLKEKDLYKGFFQSTIFTMIYGATIESLQRVVGRGADIYDYIADIVGVVLIYFIIFILLKLSKFKTKIVSVI